MRKLAVVLFFAAWPLCAQTQGGAILVPLPLFPQNNWWNIDISNAPVDAGSDGYIQFINSPYLPNGRGLHPDFGGDAGDGTIYGIPFIVVESTQAKRTVSFVYAGESDNVGYPIPDQAITQPGWIETGPPGNVDLRNDSDRHILIVDKTNNHLYELFSVFHNGTNWEAGSGAFFDMNTNNRRPEGWTSADAAGLAILPGLVRYDEVFGPDEILHAFRVTVRATNGHVYPASHTAGSTANAPKLGLRLRLKASKDISTFAPEVQKIFRAMKKYGLIIADNGSDMYVSGVYDTRWNNSVLNPAFRQLKVTDFEVIQAGWKPSYTYVLSIDSVAGSGDPMSATLTVYDGNYNVATGYTGTVRFTSTDGAATLPVDYTFTVADAGTRTFTNGFTFRTAGSRIVTMTDTADANVTGSKVVTVGPPTPTAVAATASGTSQVNVTWGASAGASQYEVLRASASSPYATIATVSTTNYADNGVSAGATYAYKVRAVDASARKSPLSRADATTTIAFSDDPLVAMTTTVKAAHLTELRQAANAMRAAGGLVTFSFTDPSVAGLAVKAVHVQELRTAIAAARTALGLSALALTDPALGAGTLVRAVHLQELRTGVK